MNAGEEMKVLKGISLFFVYPTIMLILGFVCGLQAERFFYPGENLLQSFPADKRDLTDEECIRESLDIGMEKPVISVSSRRETLCADTEYVLEEVDVLRKTSVETTQNLPSQYIGLDRIQFLATMENFQSAPPLSEQERGFESLEVLEFSRERIKVRMNYRYVQPGQVFYLAVVNHEVVAYLEDKETVYINTGIMLENLPDDMQMKIIQMYYMEGEGNLYNFLETYSS